MQQKTSLSAYFYTLLQAIDLLAPYSSGLSKLKALLKVVCKEQGYTRALISIFNMRTNALQLSVTYGEQKKPQQKAEEITRQVLQTGRPVILSYAKNDTNQRPDNKDTAEVQEPGLLCVPIKALQSGEVLGTLFVDTGLKTQEDLQSDLDFLLVVAGLISRETASLHEAAMAEHSEPAFSPFKKVIGVSKAIQQALGLVSQVGPGRSTVLIRGESGTGKELFAEAIHGKSPRAKKKLVKLNCAALPADLVESELFGYEKGAFTGAFSTKKGMFEQAHTGTLFLDEIAELSLGAQAKVLRAVQEQEIQPLGSEKVIKVDVRLICATNKPLEKMLEQKTFREDLYYRINVFPIFIPTLRERPQDILPLAEHFLERFSKEANKNISRISTPAIDLLLQYHWPGNIRELANCIERAVVICDEDVIRTYHLPPTLQTAESSATDTSLPFCEAVSRYEQELITEALKKTKGNILQAAKDMKTSYRIIHYKVKKYGIDIKK